MNWQYFLQWCVLMYLSNVCTMCIFENKHFYLISVSYSKESESLWMATKYMPLGLILFCRRNKLQFAVYWCKIMLSTDQIESFCRFTRDLYSKWYKYSLKKSPKWLSDHKGSIRGALKMHFVWLTENAAAAESVQYQRFFSFCLLLRLLHYDKHWVAPSFLKTFRRL